MSIGIAKKTSLADVIRRRVHASGPGSVVSPSDFLHLGSRAAIDQVLSRLAKEGTLQRLRRGVYYFPQVSQGLGIALSPSPDAVVGALSRGRGAEIQVAGAQAANLLGLSEQVPARVVYLTDGAAGRVEFGAQTVELRHASPRAMRAAGRVSGTVIQALRHLGKRNVTPEVIARLRATLSEEDKKTIQRDLLLAPGWMQPLLTAITDAYPAVGSFTEGD